MRATKGERVMSFGFVMLNRSEAALVVEIEILTLRLRERSG